MQQHVIDGVGAQLPAGYNSKLYEVTKYLTLTHHINLITGLVASAARYDSLPAKFKKIVCEEALKAGCTFVGGKVNLIILCIATVIVALALGLDFFPQLTSDLAQTIM